MCVGLTQASFSLPPDVDQAEFEDCVVEGSIADFLSRFDPVQVRRIFPGFDSDNYPEYDHIPPLDRFFSIHFSRDLDVPSVAEQLGQLRGVLFAEPSYFNGDAAIEMGTPPANYGRNETWNKTLSSAPNDTVFFFPTPGYDQWNLHDDGAGIGCQTAWAFTTGDSEIRIGNLDFGFWWDHPDLDIAGGFFVEAGPFGYSIVAPRQMDHSHTSHATKSAGILKASTNNNIAIAGIAGGDGSEPGCSLYDLQLSRLDLDLENAEAWSFAIESAVDPLNDFRCDIISMSLEKSEPSEILRGAIRFANEVGANVVSGNGRMSTGPRYPALFDNHWVTAVGASDTNGVVHWNSGRGFELDLIAPGERCPTTTALDSADPVFGDMNLNFYGLTSCAVPHVAGSIALLRSFLGNNLSPIDYESILKLSSRDEMADNNPQTWDFDYGHGRLHIGDAMTNASQNSIVQFATQNTSISEPEPVTVVFMSGPHAGKNTAVRYKVSGDISFSGTFTETPIVWGSADPAYPFGYHGLSKYSPNYGEPFHGVEEASVTLSGCTAFTYVYHIDEKFWYPAAPNQIPVCVKAMGPTTNKRNINLSVNEIELATIPNPFNAQIELSFRLETEDPVSIDIVDLRGRSVCTLFNQHCQPGNIDVVWNGADRSGRFLASGVYFVRVVAGSSTVVQKITLAK